MEEQLKKKNKPQRLGYKNKQQFPAWTNSSLVDIPEEEGRGRRAWMELPRPEGKSPRKLEAPIGPGSPPAQAEITAPRLQAPKSSRPSGATQ